MDKIEYVEDSDYSELPKKGYWVEKVYIDGAETKSTLYDFKYDVNSNIYGWGSQKLKFVSRIKNSDNTIIYHFDTLASGK